MYYFILSKGIIKYMNNNYDCGNAADLIKQYGFKPEEFPEIKERLEKKTIRYMKNVNISIEFRNSNGFNVRRCLKITNLCWHIFARTFILTTLKMSQFLLSNETGCLILSRNRI
jgi:hypothetical protein